MAPGDVRFFKRNKAMVKLPRGISAGMAQRKYEEPRRHARRMEHRRLTKGWGLYHDVSVTSRQDTGCRKGPRVATCCVEHVCGEKGRYGVLGGFQWRAATGTRGVKQREMALD